MSSLTSQLIKDPPAAPPAAGGVSSPEPAEVSELVPASMAEGDALAAAGDAAKLASQLSGQMQKIASAGGEVPSDATDLVTLLHKLAHYVPELIRSAQARAKYASFCLDEAAKGAQQSEALKLASELHADGILEIQDGKTFQEVVDDLGDEDLRVFKRAHDLVASGALTRFGEVDETEKTADEGGGAVGDDDESFLKAHGWLLNGHH